MKNIRILYIYLLLLFLIGCTSNSTLLNPPPYVVQFVPKEGSLDIPINSYIAITFSEQMDTDSAEGAFSLEDGTDEVNGTYSWSGDTMTFYPGGDLSYSTKYYVTVGTGARDVSGNNMASGLDSIFTTADEPDETPPSVDSVSPSNGAIDIPITTNVSISFSEQMDTGSVQGAFSLSDGTDVVSGTYSWSGETMTFYPGGDLSYSTIYYVTVGTGAKDVSGNNMASVFEPSFTTAEDPSSGSIIADHTVVDLYETIPEYWINEVKKMLISIPGESHGTGYMYGLELLETEDSTYAINVNWSGEPESVTTANLRANRAVWTGSGWGATIGEQDIWTRATAQNRVKGHITYCNSDLSNSIHAMVWGWCWDITLNGVTGVVDPVYNVRWGGNLTFIDGTPEQIPWGLDSGDSVVSMDDYLAACDVFTTYDEDTVFIFSTGPVEGGENTGESGYQRWLKHEHIRNHVSGSAAQKFLFDYADILCWNDAGIQNTTIWDGHTYQVIHPDNTGSYDGGKGGCHIGEGGCLRLGKAMWWLLARIAGWDGQPE